MTVDGVGTTVIVEAGCVIVVVETTGMLIVDAGNVTIVVRVIVCYEVGVMVLEVDDVGVLLVVVAGGIHEHALDI